MQYKSTLRYNDYACFKLEQNQWYDILGQKDTTYPVYTKQTVFKNSKRRPVMSNGRLEYYC